MGRTDKLVHPFYRPDAVLMFRILELCSFCLLVTAVVIYIRILLKREFCHPNLLILLIAQPITHILSLVFRCSTVLLALNGHLTQKLLSTLDFWCDTMICFCFQVVLCYSIERTIALKYQEYETKWASNPTIGIVLLVSSFFYSYMLIKLYFEFYLTLQMAYGFSFFLFSITALFFFRLRTISLRYYRLVADRKESTVAERFGTIRNLRSIQLLLHLAPYKCITNVISLSIFYWIFETQDSIYIPYYSFFYFELSQLQLLVQMMLTLCGHIILKRETRRFFGCLSEESTGTIRTVLGQRMIFTVSESQELYFQQLETAWAATLPRISLEGSRNKYKV